MSNLKVIGRDNWKNEIDSNMDIDILVNCAFPRTSSPEQLAKGLLFIEDLINDALDLNIEKIINVSSQSVYSQKAKLPADENSFIIPETLYGMAKYASERIIDTLCTSNKQKVCFSNIRLASLTGIGLEVRLTNKFVKNALAGQAIIVNVGKQLISYLDVKDAASAIIAMLNKDAKIWKPIYNLGNDDYCTILELANMTKEIAKKYSVFDVELKINEGHDDFNNLINSELFYKDFNWKPYYTMSLIINDLFNHYTI